MWKWGVVLFNVCCILISWRIFYFLALLFYLLFPGWWYSFKLMGRILVWNILKFVIIPGDRWIIVGAYTYFLYQCTYRIPRSILGKCFLIIKPDCFISFYFWICSYISAMRFVYINFRCIQHCKGIIWNYLYPLFGEVVLPQSVIF